MKKGQMMSQPFIYIFALILGALILVWGVKVIYDLVSVGVDVEVGKFYKDVESRAGEFSNYEEGALTNIPVTISSGKITHVCVFDPGKEIDCKIKLKSGELSGCGRLLDQDFMFVLESEAENLERAKNLYFMPLDAAELTQFRVKELKPAGANPLCYINGAKMILTSKITHVEAS